MKKLRKKLRGKDFEEIFVEENKEKDCGKIFEVISVKKVRKKLC